MTFMTEATHLTQRALAAASSFVVQQPDVVGLATPIPRLKIWSSTKPTQPTPAMFEPMFYVVLRGTKVLTIGENRFELRAGDCAAASFGMPYVSQLVGATSAAPYVAVSLAIDTALLIQIMLDMPNVEERWVCSAAGSSLGGEVGDAFCRLMELLSKPDEIKVLGHHYEAELYHRLLQSSMGDTLRQIGNRNGRLRQIQKAADWLCANRQKSFAVSDLANLSGMSLTSFYRHFKAVTGYSPIAFQRHLRLLEARRLLIAGGTSVSSAAYAVGYLSTSQFSREYRRMFGFPPFKDLPRQP